MSKKGKRSEKNKKLMVKVFLDIFFTRICSRGVTLWVAVQNPKGSSKPYGVLSTRLLFSEALKDFLVKKFQADPKGFFKKKACCLIPETKLEDFHHWLKKQAKHPFGSILELNPEDEIKKKLTTPYWKGITPPLKQEDFEKIIFKPGKLFLRPQLSNESGQKGKTPAVVRFFFAWTLGVDGDVVKRLTACHTFITLGTTDLNSTRGGTRFGTCNSLWNGQVTLDPSVGVHNHNNK